MTVFALATALALAAGPAQSFTPAPPDQVPNYFTRELTRKELEGKGLRELAILRNTIYSRYGWDGYRKPWLRDYFHAQPWFRPNPAFSYKLLSPVDLKNAHTIGTREASFGRGELEQMELALFKKYRVTFNDALKWKLPDGGVVEQCQPIDDAVALSSHDSRDCQYEDVYRRDPKSTLATLPPEARIELGLIQRAMGFFALDSDQQLADPDALDKQLKLADLRQLSGRDLRILRNTIYARRGRPFKSPVLREHFEAQPWYHVDAAYSDARLTDVDRRNVALIKTAEDELGGPLTDDEQTRQLKDPTFDAA